MSSIKSITERMRETRKGWKDEAVHLGEKLDKIEARGRAAFQAHHADLDERAKEFQEMEDDLRDLEGSNSKGEPDASDGTFHDGK